MTTIFLARANQAGMDIKHFLNNDHSLKKKYALRNFSATMDFLSKIHFSRSFYNEVQIRNAKISR